MAGLVILATERTEFEDGLRPGSPWGVLSDNSSQACTTGLDFFNVAKGSLSRTKSYFLK